MSENSWRALVAALADDRAREVYALIVLDHSVEERLAHLSPGKRRRVLDRLRSAGLIAPVEGGWKADPEVFRAALTATPAAPRPSGVERFFTEGRLSTYPSREADRQAVLAQVASHLLTPGESVTEAEITERLHGITDDPALLRRNLVDAGLLSRNPDGSAYRR
ncbi:DUF2087 domain-containing protein [Microbacterium sp. VKM Ac-2923]|uniref:DUF2087 domain-containing protein n=1 Tax=Microbacterium sp. VKM Ac-2923 TaxID=2929476 RepID=UPI001FB2AEE2|nr:DUF2087 domain-containing protein [Microbacterium sp. VKM Ac-2923]MCJ1707478.1 DUF2087 domain-containing protein [Microbacterium sp. VKM Ac-2923]